MYNILISTVANFCRIYLIRKIIMVFFEVRVLNRKLEWFLYAVFYFVNLSFFFAFQMPLINLITNLSGLFFVSFIYSGSFKKKIFVIGAVYSINMVCDTIAVFSLSNYSIGQENDQIFQIITVLLLSICLLCIEKLVAKRSLLEFSARYWGILFLIPLCSIVMLFFMLYCDLQNRLFIIIESMGVLIINIMVFYLYNAILDSYLQSLERENLKQQVEIYSNQLKVVMSTQNEIRSLQHDMKHHMKELYAMAKKDEKEEIMEYLQSMMKFTQNPEEHIYSGNKEFDGILNYMIQKAEAVLKEVNVKVCIPEDMKFPIFDLNVILGNLLENAIEASCDSVDKILNVTMKVEKNILFINILNSYNGVIQKERDKLVTTKEDKKNHGIGLGNVKKIVESYNGIMDITYENNFFEVNLMLYMGNKP